MAVGLLLILSSPYIKRWMGGVDAHDDDRAGEPVDGDPAVLSKADGVPDRPAR